MFDIRFQNIWYIAYLTSYIVQLFVILYLQPKTGNVLTSKKNFPLLARR